MRSIGFRSLFAAAVGVLLLPVVVTAATPVAFGPAAPAAPDGGGAWAVVDQGGRQGIALLEWADAAGTAARLSLHVDGLAGDDELRIVLSSATCSHAATAATRLWTGQVPTGAKGRVWRAQAAITLKHGDAEEVRTVRLMEEEGIFYYCRAVRVWDDTDIVHAYNGAVAVLDGGARHGIVVVGPADDGGSVVRWSLTIGGARDLRVVGSRSTCVAPVDPDQRVLSLPVVPTGPGVSFRNGRTETVDKDETITIAALRLKITGGASITCERPSIIAIRAS